MGVLTNVAGDILANEITFDMPVEDIFATVSSDLDCHTLAICTPDGTTVLSGLHSPPPGVKTFGDLMRTEDDNLTAPSVAPYLRRDHFMQRSVDYIRQEAEEKQ